MTCKINFAGGRVNKNRDHVPRSDPKEELQDIFPFQCVSNGSVKLRSNTDDRDVSSLLSVQIPIIE